MRKRQNKKSIISRCDDEEQQNEYLKNLNDFGKAMFNHLKTRFKRNEDENDI